MRNYFLLLLGICLIYSHTVVADQPNILLLVADDLGYAEADVLTQRKINTVSTEESLIPHIDELANSGIRFTAGYVTAPNCSPSRAGLLTGKYQTRFGYEFNPIGKKNLEPGIGLPLSEKLLPAYLKEAGYRTGAIGKWHLGGTEEFHPLNRGFDEFYGFLHEGHFYQPAPYSGLTTFLRSKSLNLNEIKEVDGIFYSNHTGGDEPPYDADNPVLRGRTPVVENTYLTQAITRESISFINKHREQPYFLYVAYNAVHSPMQGRTEIINSIKGVDNLQRKIFLSMLLDLDESVGKIIQAAEENKARSTLIIFLSDNGGPTRELTSSNLPLRGEKGQLYEGGIRVPMLMKWRNVLPAGKTYDKMVSSLDILPTILSAAGGDSLSNLDGVNLLPYLQGNKPDHPQQEHYWRQGNKGAIRFQNWKIVTNNLNKREVVWELYNLQDDLKEEHNVAEKYPDQLNKLLSRWKELNQQMKPAIFK